MLNDSSQLVSKELELFCPCFLTSYYNKICINLCSYCGKSMQFLELREECKKHRKVYCLNAWFGLFMSKQDVLNCTAPGWLKIEMCACA